MRPVRVSTIVWGVLLLLLGGVAFAVTALDIQLFSGTSIAYLVVGLGALLVVAALVGAIARAVKPSPVLEPVETPAATSEAKKRVRKDQPVD